MSKKILTAQSLTGHPDIVLIIELPVDNFV